MHWMGYIMIGVWIGIFLGIIIAGLFRKNLDYEDEYFND